MSSQCFRGPYLSHQSKLEAYSSFREILGLAGESKGKEVEYIFGRRLRWQLSISHINIFFICFNIELGLLVFDNHCIFSLLLLLLLL